MDSIPLTHIVILNVKAIMNYCSIGNRYIYIFNSINKHITIFFSKHYVIYLLKVIINN